MSIYLCPPPMVETRNYSNILTITTNKCNVTCVSSFICLHECHIIILLTGGLVVVSYGSAPLLRQLCLDTERIIIPFSSKGVNHIGYLAHVATVEGCVLRFV